MADGSKNDSLSEGLITFYSSQAEAALAKHDNIVQLLGETTDWTAPGTACELLIREIVRNALPSQYSIDKGFIYGVSQRNGKQKHSPEIDILIHDGHAYAPLFRMDDFVIVQPEAVRGVIQVKRTLDSNTLKKAVKNVVHAKKHIKECNQGSYSLDKVFAGVVAFRDEIQERKDGKLSKTYINSISDQFGEYSDGYFMPNFVGSLNKKFLAFSGVNSLKMSYGSFPSEKNGKNLAIQAFLLILTQTIKDPFKINRPFAFPDDYEEEGVFVIFEKVKKG